MATGKLIFILLSYLTSQNTEIIVVNVLLVHIANPDGTQLKLSIGHWQVECNPKLYSEVTALSQGIISLTLLT